MTEPTPKQVVKSIRTLTTWLVSEGLADQQEWPKLIGDNHSGSVTTANPVDSSVLRDVSYEDLYDDQIRRRAFNAVLLDGALIQMSYDFTSRKLVRHRLAYLPSPRLLDFQNLPEIYLNDIPFIEIVGTQVVTVPVRFDFDIRDEVEVGVTHPAAHLTLGQYRHCRIPVSAPVTPAVFIDFVVQHFYRTPETSSIRPDRELELAFDLSVPAIDLEAIHLISPGRR